MRNATVTAAGYPVGTVICVQAKDMKEAWCLATSVSGETAKALMIFTANAGALSAGYATRRTCGSAGGGFMV